MKNSVTAASAMWLVACTSTAPHPSNAPSPAHAPVSGAQPTAGAAAAGSASVAAVPLGPPPRYIAGHLVYDLTSVGVVSSPGDTTARADTTTTATRLTYNAKWSGSDLRLSGDVATQVSGTSPVSQPTTFDATVDSATGMIIFGHGIDSSRTTGSTCPAGGPAVDKAREFATERPRSLASGATWQDTLTARSCLLSDVPLVTRAVRVYTVSAEPIADPVSGTESVMVSQTMQETMIGGGPHLGRQITLNGKGDGTTEQYYDRTTGVVLSAHTVVSLQLDVGEAGRVERLMQHADWRARLASYNAHAQ